MKKTKKTSNQCDECNNTFNHEPNIIGNSEEPIIICNNCYQKQYPEETFGLASETSTREQAIIWWNNITYGKKQHLIIENLGHQRALTKLTGREIEEIWKNQLPLEERESYYGMYKPN